MQLAVEPPRGVKAKLLRTYTNAHGADGVSEDLHEAIAGLRSFSWKCILFGLSFFNAVLHERKKYNQLGWNVSYEFTDSDLEVGIFQISRLTGEAIVGLNYSIP